MNKQPGSEPASAHPIHSRRLLHQFRLDRWLLLLGLLVAHYSLVAQCFSSRPSPSGNGPTSVAIGDLNKDGLVDLAIANYKDNTVSVQMNTGNGGSNTYVYPVGAGPRSVAIGDLNGDGRPDLVSANTDNNTVTVLINQVGSGNFLVSPNYPSGTTPISVAIGDLNGDGTADIATANINGGSVWVLFNKGTGAEFDTRSYPTGLGATSIAIGDLNGDGRADIATANITGNNVTVLLKQSTAFGFAATNYPVSGGPNGIAIGDLNGDRKVDLITASRNSNVVTVLLNDGTGTAFASSTYPVGSGPRSVAIGDLNGDGQADLATANFTSNDVTLLINKGTGTDFTAATYPVGTGPTSVGIGNVDEDGRADLATANYNANEVSFLYNLGNPVGITQQPPSTSAVCPGASVSASVSTSGVVTSYQWYQNGTKVAGQNTAMLSLTNVQPTNTGSYSVVVTSACNSVTSTAFNLTVNPLPTATLTSNGPLTCAQTSVTLTAGGGGSYTFSAGASQIGTTNQATVNEPGTYSVTVTSASGCITTTSTSVTLNLDAVPPGPDYQPLVDFYNSTKGATWTNKTNWLTNCDVCSWYGISCTNGRVTGIDMTSNNLSGTLPASLSGLTSLQSLALGTNQLTGPIPASLGTLPALQTLILFQNSLTGAIPASLGSRMGLQVLNLSANQLDGAIPDQLGALTQLRALNLSNNRLMGTLPASLSTLTGVQFFDLSRNQLTGSIPAGYGALQNTIALNINNNQLSGCFPTSLSALCTYGPVSESLPAPGNQSRARVAGNGINDKVNVNNNSGLPGGGDFDSFCASGAGSCNTPPVVANTIPNQTATVGQAFSYTLPANTFTDPEGQAITVAVTGLPSGLTYSANSSVISGTISSTVGSPVSVTVTATDTGGLSARTVFTLTINAPTPVNTAPVATANTSQTATVGVAFSYTVNAFADAETPGSLTYTTSINPTNGLSFNPITRIISGTPTAVGPVSVTVTATDPGGLSASTSFSIAVQAAPVVVTPLALTLTASQTTLPTSGTTTLTATASGGTNPYRYTFSGPGTIITSNNTARVTNLPAGVQTFTVVVSDATAPTNQTITKTVSVTVTAPATITALRVLHLDADNSLTNNAIKPTLQVANEGTAPIDYGQLTLRYWLTVEQFAPLTNLSVYYAQLGTAKVKMKYVALDKPRQGAFGYVEYSFDGSAGSLAAGANSGPVQTGIAKQDYTAFNEADDYSYANNRNLTANNRITAYLNGQLVWGAEPAEVVIQRTVKAYTENKNGSSTNTISTFLQVRNEGNVAVSYSDLKVRYYFTSEGSQPLNFYLDYAVLGNQKVRGQFGRLNPPLANADAYLELSFDASLGTFNPGSSTGNIQYRIAKQDWSNFTQSNDYSYQNGTQPLTENSRVVVYLAGQRVFGTEPGAGARQGVADNDAPLQVTVLGNPVTGAEVSFEVVGAEGQSLQMQLTDVSGRPISEQAIEKAGARERQTLPIVNQKAGILLLRVSTPTQSQTVKLLKVD